jgi:hypothetical protein
MTRPTKEQIIEKLIENCEDSNNDLRVQLEDVWTIAELFIRQHLNNGCDGFGMRNVAEMYEYLCEHKEELIEYDLISKVGFNNHGFPLWKDYDFDGWIRSTDGQKYYGLIDESGKSRPTLRRD